jgi:hypothetical protein
MLQAAVEYAEHRWNIYPLLGKAPRIPRAHRPPDPQQCCVHPPGRPDPFYGKRCRGECGRLGHGHYDATCDLERVTKWWSKDYPGADIGCRIPDTMMVIDIDPRHGGDLVWARRLAKYPEEPWPEGMQDISGRGDGGLHLWLRRPPGLLRMPLWLSENGVELKLHCAILPPSRHEETGGQYQRIDGRYRLHPRGSSS